MRESLFFLLNALLLAATAVSLWIWVRTLRSFAGQTSLTLSEYVLPVRPRRRPFWSPADLLIMLGVMILLGYGLTMWMSSQGWLQLPEDRGDEPRSESDLIASMVANSVAGIAGVAIVLGWLRWFDRAAPWRIGLWVSVDDFWLGLKASLVILPPVLLISAAVTVLIPYEHPVLESLTALSTPVVFMVMFVGTAIVTPVIEEFMVRGLLQGGLQGLADREAIADQEDELGEAWRPQSWWPLIVSSGVFSLLHLGQGGGPIPLFFLSLGLGFLYRQTGRLGPPIVVHMVLNGLTLIAEVTKPV